MRASGLAALLLLEGCSLFVDTSGLDTQSDAALDAPKDATQDGARDAARDGGVDAPADAGKDGPSRDAGVDASDGALACPTGRGPAMVRAGDVFCVDSTEATNADYAAFLATSPSLSVQPPECAWNTTYVPGTGWPVMSGREQHPVVYVDWCDAHAFCAWAGKRICGAIDGGSFASSDFANPSVAQHYFACSLAASRVYPYGDTWDPVACNGVNAGVGDTIPVGSLSGCVGGYPGLFDMVGNVEEWEDSCAGDGGSGDPCIDGTGAFDYPGGDGGPTGTRCDFFDSDYRNAQYQDVGIRCCWP